MQLEIDAQLDLSDLNAILEQDLETSCRLLSDHIHLSYQEAINTMMHTSF